MPDSRRALGALACACVLACDFEQAPPRPRVAATPSGPRPFIPRGVEALSDDAFVARVRPAIVRVEGLDRKGGVLRSGGGVVVARGVVAVPWAVVSQAAGIRVQRGSDVRHATLAAVSERQGLARIAVDLEEPADLARDPYPPPGTSVRMAVAEGNGIRIEDATVGGTSDGPGDRDDLMVLSVSPTARFAGAGLFDESGRLVGMVDPPEPKAGVSTVTPVRYLKDLLALPEGTLPRVTKSPLARLSLANRAWLVSVVGASAREDRPLRAEDEERARALIASLEPLAGAELAWARIELGHGWLMHRRLLWEDAIDARTFERVSRSDRRAALESKLRELGVLTGRDIEASEAMIRSIAAREPFEYAGQRIVADERWIGAAIATVDRARARLDRSLWATR